MNGGDYIPDPIELGESMAESAYEEMLQSDGRLKCGCGNIFDADKEGGTLSPDPYAMPVCPACLEKFCSSNMALSVKTDDSK